MQSLNGIKAISHNSLYGHYVVAEPINGDWNWDGETVISLVKNNEVIASETNPKGLNQLGEHSWVTVDDSGRWIIAATSRSTSKDIFNINVFKYVTYDWSGRRYKMLVLWQERIATIREKDIHTVSFQNANFMWVDSDS